MVFSTAFKVYTTLSARRFISDLTDAYAKGYLSKLPHHNFIFNYLDKAELKPIIRKLITLSSLPLKAVKTNFAVDSSGFRTSRFVRWYNAKHGREVDNQDRLRVHLMASVKTKLQHEA